MRKGVIPAAAMLAITFASLISAPTGHAQSAGSGDGKLPVLLPEDQEIALARSAAPAAVSKDATVLVLRRGGYETASKGSNGVTCYVSRSWAEAIEPHCFDREGSETILPMQLHRARLREQQIPRSEIDATIAQGIVDGTFRIPRRPAISWMMSEEQRLHNDSGDFVGKWKPHLMIYYPYLTSADLGILGGPSLAAGAVVDGGTPTANLMIVVPDFVSVEPQQNGPATDGR